LGTKSTDAPLGQDMVLSGQVVDFQDMKMGVAMAEVQAFADIDYQHPLPTVTADNKGQFQITIPKGQVRVGFKVHAASYFDTFLLNQYGPPASTTGTLGIGDISMSLASALGAFTNFERTPGTGVLAGAMRDCQHREVSNAIATVSSVSMQATHLTGM